MVSSQASFELPQAAKFEPYTPRINLDSANVKQNKDFAASLKKHLTESFKLPPEARLQRLKTAGPEGTLAARGARSPGPAAALLRGVGVEITKVGNEIVVCAEAKSTAPVQARAGAKKKLESK